MDLDAIIEVMDESIDLLEREHISTSAAGEKNRQEYIKIALNYQKQAKAAIQIVKSKEVL